MLHHGHLVLGQGTCLIGADDLCAAQGFHGSEPTNHCVALAHLSNTDGQHHGHHRGKALRNGGNCQGHGHHKGLQNGA